MSETPNLAKVALEDASEKLRDAIKLAFVEVIPPEQWQAMIKAELEKFTQPRRVRDQWDRWVDRPSVLSEICEQQFREFAKKLVERELAKPEYSGDAVLVSQAVGEWLTANQAALIQQTVAALLGGAAQNVLSQARGVFIHPERL